MTPREQDADMIAGLLKEHGPMPQEAILDRLGIDAWGGRRIEWAMADAWEAKLIESFQGRYRDKGRARKLWRSREAPRGFP